MSRRYLKTKLTLVAMAAGGIFAGTAALLVSAPGADAVVELPVVATAILDRATVAGTPLPASTPAPATTTATQPAVTAPAQTATPAATARARQSRGS
ncbi:MAG: hypothetical protein R3B97_06590 [Dehalococcoidia bacterium]|nr:hypothetical protein [Dehalococcoidia bacterium]MCB9487049.1 hypothetical protein [Thermoflexaceae bacterium]